MAGHPQSAPKGLFQKNRIDIGYNELTYNSTTKGLTISNSGKTLATALPGSVRIATNPTLVPINNSTGRCLAFNTTGTTWLFVSGTTAQPTT